MAPRSEEDRFNLEVLKLLLKVAASDGHVDPREVELIEGAGRSWLVPEPELHALVTAAREGHDRAELGALAEPDLALLRTRRDDVLQAVGAMVAADGVLQLEERGVLRSVRALLGAG